MRFSNFPCLMFIFRQKKIVANWANDLSDKICSQSKGIFCKWSLFQQHYSIDDDLCRSKSWLDEARHPMTRTKQTLDRVCKKMVLVETVFAQRETDNYSLHFFQVFYACLIALYVCIYMYNMNSEIIYIYYNVDMKIIRVCHKYIT